MPPMRSRAGRIHQTLLLRDAFAAWRSAVDARVVQARQAAAALAWSRQQRAFAAWHSAARQRTIDRLAAKREREAVDRQRREFRAIRMHRRRTLSRLFLHWVSWTRLRRDEALLEFEHQQRKRQLDRMVDQLRIQKEAEQRERARRQPAPAARYQRASTTFSSTSSGADDEATQSSIPEELPEESVDSLAMSECSVSMVSALTELDRNSLSLAGSRERKHVSQMEKRTRERQERRALLKKQYEERLRIQRLEAERKEERARQEAVRAKHEQIQRRREERRRKEEAAAARERERERMAELMELATLVRRRLLVKYSGLVPWRKALFVARLGERRAELHRRGALARSGFRAWKLVWLTDKRRSIMQARANLEKAVYQDRFAAKRRAWRALRALARQHQDKVARARRFHLLAVVRRALAGWRLFHEIEQHQALLQDERDARRMRPVADKLVAGHYLARWRRFVGVSRREKRSEIRRNELRAKARSYLSEYRSTR